jgi:hypothetical protein
VSLVVFRPVPVLTSSFSGGRAGGQITYDKPELVKIQILDPTGIAKKEARLDAQKAVRARDLELARSTGMVPPTYEDPPSEVDSDEESDEEGEIGADEILEM